MQTFHLNKTQKTSRLLLGGIFCLSIIGFPIGIWLIIIAFSKVTLNNNSVQVSPLGKSFHISNIKRIGIGSLKQLITGNSSLNPSASPQHISALIMLVELKSGKRIRIALANYESGLSQAIIQASKLKTVPLKNSALFPWKVDFIN